MLLLLRQTTLMLSLALTPLVGARAALIGEIDSFQTLTLEGWFAGGGSSGQVPAVPPQVIATGGPAGAGDAFMRITAVGTSFPGGRLVAQNNTQWAGDYLTPGITGIRMDLANLGAADLTIRLELIRDLDDRLVTSAAAVLPQGSGWTQMTFDLSPDDLVALLGDANAALGDLTLLRIIHAPTAAFTNLSVAVPIVGQLGVDNITAIGSSGGGIVVPEPSGLLLLATSLFALAASTRLTRSQLGRSQLG